MYMRVRGNIGRQPFEPKRIKSRIIILGIIGALLGAMMAMRPLALLAFAGGAAGSVLLAWLGVTLTRFERTGSGDFYTPNTIIGVTLSLLLIGRFVYRFIVVYNAMHSGMPEGPQAFQSPLTGAIIGLTFGYYVAYYIGVLIHGNRLGTPRL